MLAEAERVANMGSFEFNIGEDKIRWSKQERRLFGVDPEGPDMRLEDVLELVHPDDLLSVREMIRKGLSGETPYEFESRIIRPDGEVRHIHTRAEVFRNEQGEAVRVLGTTLDITERKQAEEALRESERMLAEAERVGNMGSFEFNVGQDTIRWSRQERRLFGVDPEGPNLTLEQVLDLAHPDDLPFVREAIRKGLAGEAPYEFENRIVRPDGEIRYIQTRAEVYRNEQGEAVRVLGTTLDITDRKQAEEALFFERNLLYSLLDHIPDSIYYKDEENRYLRVSKSKEAHLGVPSSEIVGKTDFDFYPPDQAEEMAADDRRVMEEEEPIIGKVEHVVRPDGAERWVSVTKIPRYDETGRVVGTLGISRDITAMRRMEEETRQQERLAAVGQLSAGIAHDFRNLLTTIILYANMALRSEGLPPELARYLKTIVGESKKAANLVQQILDFSSRSMIDLEAIDPSRLTRDVIDVLRRTIPESIRLSLETDLPPVAIKADPGRIQQALMNLALNSRDAMPEGGELLFRLSRVDLEAGDESPVADMPAGEWVCLTVADTGTGMTKEVQSHLFEPFFTTKEVGKGTGLGLAQVYGIIRQHDGYVGVETEVGKGTAFHIYLPQVEVPLEEAEQSTVTAPRGQGETILLVEDNDKLRRAGQAILESLGYRVLAATNGREALSIYEVESEVDLVVTDIVMPEMGGKALVEKMKRAAPGLKAIGITGYTVTQVVSELKEVGFSDVIHKPFGVEELTGIIRRVLDEQ